MSPLIVWPKNPKIEDVIGAVNGLEVRITALENKLDQAIEDFQQFSIQVNAAKDELENRSEEAFSKVAQNVEAIKAILTILHPDPEHPIVTDEEIPHGEWLHGLIMYWIEKYGRLTPTEEP